MPLPAMSGAEPPDGLDYMRIPQLVVEGLSHGRSPNQPSIVLVMSGRCALPLISSNREIRLFNLPGD
jgi:hypothetical protein